jgi:hypothetical protein
MPLMTAVGSEDLTAVVGGVTATGSAMVLGISMAGSGS